MAHLFQGGLSRIDEYLSNGFPLIWVVYISVRVVVIYRAGGSIRMLHEHEEITGESALPGFRVRVVELFGPKPLETPPSLDAAAETQSNLEMADGGWLPRRGFTV